MLNAPERFVLWLLFVAGSTIDACTTLIGLRVGARESMFIGQWAIENWGPMGIVYLKIAAIIFVGIALIPKRSQLIGTIIVFQGLLGLSAGIINTVYILQILN